MNNISVTSSLENILFPANKNDIPDASFSLFAQFYTFQIIRYILISGGLFFFVYKLRISKWKSRQIPKKLPDEEDYKREVRWSIFSLGIFSLIAMIVLWGYKHGYTKMYPNFHEYGWGYFFFTVLLSLILHDFYFYWTHRLMHHPWLYQKVHKVHHLSHSPSPWAAFAFHPFEAFINAGFLLIYINLLPVHLTCVLAFILLMTGMNVIGHCSYELFPAFNTVTNNCVHHNMHHAHLNCNYGLYLNFWDRVMGTNHPEYEVTFKRIVPGKTA